MPAYMTPGVYVEEITKLPPSVAEVSTAIPAFIGYTEKRPKGADTAKPAVARVSTLLEYTELFGGPSKATFKATVGEDGALLDVASSASQQFLLYYAISHYLKNGGGPCYVVSAGKYSAGAIDKEELSRAIDRLRQEDEPTLLVLTDAVNLTAPADYHELCQAALRQCHDLGDRFAILDVSGAGAKTDVTAFRDGIGTNYLAYGAAYYPYLQTSLSYAYDETGVEITPWRKWSKVIAPNTITVSHSDAAKRTPEVTVAADSVGSGVSFAVSSETAGAPAGLTITLGTGGEAQDYKGADVVRAWDTWKAANQDVAFELATAGTGAANLTALAATALDLVPLVKEIAPDTIVVTYIGEGGASVTVVKGSTITFSSTASGTLTITVNDGATGGAVAAAAAAPGSGVPVGFTVSKAGTGNASLPIGTTVIAPGGTLESIKTTDTALYNRIKARLAEQRVILPPSAAVAGVYASVDRDRGVWKAPANVSVSAVIGPVTRITHEDQESLNVDTAGKSINAIRAFSGKGTLVWGARTLDGNNNEWRYVPVRRLFIMIEESARKATSFAVFEPNDMTTWLKVKGMIESFLYGLWERGALAGAKPEQAYFVNVGLGKTMTTTDILEGRMIVEIGVAAVRPAEFIVLRFSHKLQEA